MGVKLKLEIAISCLIFLIIFRLAEAEPPDTKSSCKDFFCGDLKITYPFGMNKDCYYNPSFEIFCNKSTNPPTPIIKSINLEVISFTDDLVLVKSPVKSINCPDLPNEEQTSINLTGTPFFFGRTNTFNVIGCNTRAMISNPPPSLPQMSGCDTDYPSGRQRNLELPRTFSELVNEAESRRKVGEKCTGSNSCCQVPVTEYVKVFDPILEAKEGNNSSCRLAFLSFGMPENLTQIKFQTTSIYLWWIFYVDEMEFDASTTNCVTSSDRSLDNRSFYDSCVCNDGYEGNPYLGCKDVDECKESQICSGLTKCVNKLGSYKCEVDTKWIIIIVIGGVCGVLAMIFFIWWVHKYMRRIKESERKKKFFKKNGGLLLQEQLASSTDGLYTSRIFSSKELEKATDGFNENRILGEGGQGTVFKGMLADGRIIAVKKSKLTDKKKLQLVDEKKVKEFVNEVVILSKINHRNVVKLIGCCLETEVPLLVYEFVPNGSLFDYLHDKNRKVPFLWQMRLKIASEAAGALAYLHSAASVPIYHRDIKSSNILLDDKYRAKISDFGTSRLISIDQTHLTTRVLGTFGYFDPEYYISSQFTEKSDVYSFGVVLVELLSGKRPIFPSETQSEETVSLVTHFKEKKLFDIVDGYIMEHCHAKEEEEEIVAFANLAKRCLNSDGKNRPTMKEVAMELERIRSSPNNNNQLNVAENNEEIQQVYCEVTAACDCNISTSNFSTMSLEVDPLISYKY